MHDDGTRERIMMVGQLISIQERVSQKGNKFAFLQFTDKSGIFEVTCFSDLLSSNKNILYEGNVLMINAEARNENGGIRLLAQHFRCLEDKISSEHSGLGIWVETSDCLNDIKSILVDDGKGRAQVEINIKDSSSQIKMRLPNCFQLSSKSREKLKSVPGILKIEDIFENA